MQKTHGIIFDFGRVLGNFDHRRACESLARFTALSPDEIRNTLFKAGGVYHQHEDGSLSSPAFFEEARHATHLSDELGFEEFCRIWPDIFDENPGIDEVIGWIDPAVRRVILSNTDPLHWTAIERLPVVQKYFADPKLVIRSYDVGTRKPDERMFRAALERLGTKPEQTLYIDDIRDYLCAAEKLGIQTESYDSSKDPIDRIKYILNQYGVLR